MLRARWLSPWFAAIAAFSIDAANTEPTSERYQLDRLVPASNFHGVHGLAFDAHDVLYAGSVVGHSIYRVDTKTGAVATFVGAPEVQELTYLRDENSRLIRLVGELKVKIRRLEKESVTSKQHRPEQPRQY